VEPGDEQDGSGATWAAALRSRYVAAAVGAFAYWTAIEALRPMVALQLQRIGATSVEVGVAVAAFALLAFVLSVPGGAAVDRLGPRRLLIAGFAVTVGCGLAYRTFATSVLGLTVVQSITGIAALLVWVSLQAAVTHAGTGEGLRRQLVIFSTAWAAGSAVGPVLGGWLFEVGGFSGIAGLLGATGGVGLVAALSLPRVRPAHDAPAVAMLSGARSLLGSAPMRLVLAASFVSLAAQTLRSSFYPIFLTGQGLGPRDVGLVLTAIGSVSVVARLGLPALGRRFAATAVLWGSTWLAIAWLVTIPLMTGPALIVVGALMVGVSLGLHPPVTVELIAAAAPANLRGTAMGMRVMANRSGQLVAPLVFGAVALAAGPPAAFVASGAVLSGVLGAAAARDRRSSSPAVPG
jgi:MFS family permease